MKIGVVAEKLDIASSAIRYYERIGLIQPIGRVSGRREIDEQTIVTLRFIIMAQSAGLALTEIRQLLNIGFGEARKDDDWLVFLQSKRNAVLKQMQDLNRMDQMLAKFENCSCTSLNDCMSGARA